MGQLANCTKCKMQLRPSSVQIENEEREVADLCFCRNCQKYFEVRLVDGRYIAKERDGLPISARRR